MSLGQKIKQLRKENKISAEIVGKYIGKPGKQAIYDIEQGRVKNLDLDSINKLCKLFSVDISFFTQENEKANDPSGFYTPGINSSDINVSAEKLAFLLEENRTLWRENALLKKVIIENNIEVTFSK